MDFSVIVFITPTCQGAQRASLSPLQELEVWGHRPPYLLVRTPNPSWSPPSLLSSSSVTFFTLVTDSKSSPLTPHRVECGVTPSSSPVTVLYFSVLYGEHECQYCSCVHLIIVFFFIKLRAVRIWSWTLGKAKGGMVAGVGGGHHVGQEHPGLPLQGEDQEKENITHSLLSFLFT